MVDDRYCRMLDAIGDAFIGLDPQGQVLYLNAKAAAIFGRPASELVGRNIWLEYPEVVGHPFQLAAERAMREQRLVAVEAYYAPFDRWFEQRMHPSPDGLVVLATDITAQKRDEAERTALVEHVHALALRFLAATEDERRRVARELHDGIGQAISMAKLELGRAPPRVDHAAEILRLALEEVRRLAIDLRPAMLDDLGLPDAIETHARRVADAAGLGLELDVVRPAGRWPELVETTLFRVCQEALANAIRHAGAGTLRVCLANGSGVVRLSVSDDGRGFDEDRARAASRSGTSSGLSIMEERMRLAGGTAHLESTHGGTTWTFSLPLPEPR